METKQIITLGKDGKYYNQFGSLAFPNMSKAAIRRWHGIKDKSIFERSFAEFEIQAVTYVNLVNYFKGHNIIRGEHCLSKKDGKHYCRCDIAILDEKCINPMLIIEVKRNKNEILHSKGQIQNYYNFCDKVIVISSMEEAENIVNTIVHLNIK